MNKKIKIISLIIVLILGVLCLTGCTNNNSTNTEENTEENKDTYIKPYTPQIHVFATSSGTRLMMF